MEFVFCILILGGTFFIGKVLATKLKRKENFYFDCYNFCQQYASNLQFRQLALNKLIVQGSYSSDFTKMTESFLQGENCRPQLSLDASEWSNIERFLSILGKNDANTAYKETEFFLNYFCSQLTLARDAAKSRVPMVQKISLLFGFLLCILII